MQMHPVAIYLSDTCTRKLSLPEKSCHKSISQMQHERVALIHGEQSSIVKQLSVAPRRRGELNFEIKQKLSDSRALGRGQP